MQDPRRKIEPRIQPRLTLRQAAEAALAPPETEVTYPRAVRVPSRLTAQATPTE
jgi:hypothetical protein